MELLFEIAGWAGAVAMLGGYMAVSMGWLQAGSTFQTVNLFGSCALSSMARSTEPGPPW